MAHESIDKKQLGGVRKKTGDPMGRPPLITDENRRDQLLGNMDDEDIRRAEKITHSFPWGAFLGEALGLLLESGISHLNKGPLVLILSLALWVSGWTSDVQALLILGAILFLLGVFMSAEGLKRWRMESLDEIFRKANANP